MQTFEQIMKEQFKRRNIKYRLFFTGLLLEKYIFMFDGIDNANKRGLLLRNYYFLMRYLDDIIDNNIVVNNYNSIEDRVKYLEGKLEHITCKVTPKDNVDKMINECHTFAQKLVFSMDEESKYIISSLIFDGYRLLEWQKNKELKIVSSKELEKHFYDLDILGTISGCLKIYDEDKKYLDILYPLGTASRKYYDMRDFIEDMRIGLINISLEDLNKYNITESDIRTVMSINEKYIDICKNKGFNNEKLLKLIPSSILDLLYDNCMYCENQLSKYHNNLIDNDLPILRNSTNMTLKVGYEYSIKKYLKKINSNK